MWPRTRVISPRRRSPCSRDTRAAAQIQRRSVREGAGAGGRGHLSEEKRGLGRGTGCSIRARLRAAHAGSGGKGASAWGRGECCAGRSHTCAVFHHVSCALRRWQQQQQQQSTARNSQCEWLAHAARRFLRPPRPSRASVARLPHHAAVSSPRAHEHRCGGGSVRGGGGGSVQGGTGLLAQFQEKQIELKAEVMLVLRLRSVALST